MDRINNMNTRQLTVLAGEKGYELFNGMWSELIIEIVFTGTNTGVTVYDSISSYDILNGIKNDGDARTNATWRAWTNGTITDSTADAGKIAIASCPSGVEIDNTGATDISVNIRLNR